MKCDNGDCALYYAELNNDNNELIYGFNCSDNQDCYYKQLQRLKEEITKLSDPRYQISKVNEGYYNRMNTYKQALKEIKDIVSEPCIVDENCQTCNSGCMQKDILAKINEVIGAE